VELFGRRAEIAVLDQLVDAVCAGGSRALVISGESGVGKTALLDYVGERASKCRVIRASGVQSEMELAFAALHQLCGPILNRLERLPEPQRDALQTAFGMVAYREAIERLSRSRMRSELARAHLLYGEWLRRERRRTDARTQLCIAQDMLDAMGMDAFAERARREREATGESARRHTAAANAEQLTAQEAQIARLARDGLSNPEIGARLFISARTVQYHLRKVFSKFDISSRSQLDRVL
jgi:DNA-binding CsgD family transcriptional regulator